MGGWPRNRPKLGLDAGPTPLVEQSTESVGSATGTGVCIQWVAWLSQMGYLARLMETGSAVDAKLKESTDRQLREPSAVPMMHGGLGIMHRGGRPCTLCIVLKLEWLGLGLRLGLTLEPRGIWQLMCTYLGHCAIPSYIE